MYRRGCFSQNRCSEYATDVIHSNESIAVGNFPMIQKISRWHQYGAIARDRWNLSYYCTEIIILACNYIQQSGCLLEGTRDVLRIHYQWLGRNHQQVSPAGTQGTTKQRYLADQMDTLWLSYRIRHVQPLTYFRLLDVKSALWQCSVSSRCPTRYLHRRCHQTTGAFPQT